MPRRSYTLIEMLAVMALLGLLAALAAPGVVRAMTGDPLQAAADRLSRAMRGARAAAFGRAVAIELAPWGFAVGGPGGVTLRLPDGIAAAWTCDGRPAQRLALDPRGHGPDTRLVLAQGRREISLVIDGLTGQWMAESP